MFLIFSLIFTANLANPRALIGGLTGLDRGTTIGGEVTEIVSASSVDGPVAGPIENSLLLQSVLAASTVEINDNAADIDLESAPYNERDPLITGGDSILQNQNPITVPTVEPRSGGAPLPAPYYGPSLDGYFIFPTIGFNRGRLHAYNAVDISRGDDCLSENISVFAAASGVVSATYPTESASRYANSGYGNYIIILSPNGVTALYAHLKSILVEAGQYVNQGSIIAFMGGYPGNPGSGNSTGCHLHFGVRGAKNPFVR